MTMKMIEKSHLSAILLAAPLMFGLLVMADANASLVSLDLSTAGDGLITYDSNTGFSWLDLTATAGRSYNEVAGGYGGFTNSFGFRYATGDEVGGLFTAAGVSQGADSQISTKATLMALMGGYLYYNFWSTQSYGITGSTTLSVPGVSHDIAMLGYDNFYAPNSYAYQAAGAFYDNTTAYYVGSFLVKDATTVPLPAAVWLMGSGLAGLLGFGTLRQTQHESRSNIPTSA